MATRSPQDTPLVKLRPEASTRFQGAVAPQINTTALGTVSKVLQAKDKAQTEFIQTSTENKLEELRLQGQTALSEHEGISSLDASRKINEKYQSGAQKILESVPEQLRPQLENSVVKSGVRFNSFVTPYVHQQVKKVEKAAYDTKVANDANAAVESSGDMNSFLNEGLPAVAESIALRARKLYGDDPNVMTKSGVTTGELVQAEVQKGLSETIFSAIKIQADTGNVEHAKSLNENLNGNLVTADKLKVAKLFKKLEQNDEVRLPVDMAITISKMAGGNIVYANELAKKFAPDTKTYLKVRDILRADEEIEKKQKAKNDDDLIAKYHDQAEKGTPVTADQLNQITDFKKIKSFSTYLHSSPNGARVSTEETTEKLNTVFGSDNLEDITSLNLKAYKHLLSPSDYKEYDKLQKDMTKKDEKGRYKASQSDYREVMDYVLPLYSGKTKREKEQLKLLAIKEYNRIRDTHPEYHVSDIKKAFAASYVDRAYTPRQETGFFSFDIPAKVSTTLDPFEGKTIDPSWKDYLRKRYRRNLGSKYTEDFEVKMINSLIERHGEDIIKNPMPVRSKAP
jgi:hypothetical protein